MFPIMANIKYPIAVKALTIALLLNESIAPINPITITGTTVRSIAEAYLVKNNVLLLTGRLPNKSTLLLLCI